MSSMTAKLSMMSFVFDFIMVYVRAKLTFGFFGDTHDLLFGKRISCVIDLFPSFSLLGTKRKPVIELVVVKIRTYIHMYSRI